MKKHITRSITCGLALLAFCSLPLEARAAGAKLCPVTGDTLGGDNGEPVPIEYKGQIIKVCCKSCAKKFKANPEKYMSGADAKGAKGGKPKK